MTDETNEEVQYSVQTRCPKCGREHITAFRLRHISDEMLKQLMSLRLGDFFCYAVHTDPQGATCPNSTQHLEWSPRK